MLSSAVAATSTLRVTSGLTLRRCLSLGATSCQQQQPSDPIQELFVQKVREYANKKKSAGGKLVDADAKVQEGLNKELDKVAKQFGNMKAADTTKFPDVKFAEYKVQRVDQVQQQ